ncbi:MAG: papain-like cysteine protease family protein, partial [Deltaproteobacteria bacterium]
GYKSNGVIMLIPLYDSASPLLIAGTKYLFTDIAAQIKREVQTARDEYHDMIPPVSGDTSTPKPTAAASSTPLKATGKASKILGVSLSAQEQDEWCWAASGRMTMLFLGGDLGKITQCEQANTAQSQTKCCTDGSSAACNKPHYPEYDKWGFTAQYSDSATPPSWELLKGSIDGGKPLAFGWQWNAGGGHMMVAVGYYEDASTTPAKRMVNVYDPWPVNVGKKQSMTYSAWTGGEDYKWGGYFYNITKDVKKTAVKERISRLHVGEQIQVKRLLQGKQLLARVGQIPT